MPLTEFASFDALANVAEYIALAVMAVILLTAAVLTLPRERGR